MLSVKKIVVAALFFCLFGMVTARAAPEWKNLNGHVPSPVRRLTAMGRLPATNELRLAIGLPLRDAAGLDVFLRQLADPASPNYKKYLTPEQFAAQFGPTESDYATVEQFARTNGLRITATHVNRLLLDVAGPVSSVEKTFHISLRTYRHPHEARDFFAPDTEPTVDKSLPVVDIQGLSDYSLPHPNLVKKNLLSTTPKFGSAADGYSYFGDDFRAAYVPGTTLNGAGQTVGLLQFDVITRVTLQLTPRLRAAGAQTLSFRKFYSMVTAAALPASTAMPKCRSILRWRWRWRRRSQK